MAAKFLYGMDSGMVLPDLLAMSEADKASFRTEVKRRMSEGWGIHQDGQVFLVPCMLYYLTWRNNEFGRYVERSAGLPWMSDLYRFIGEQGFRIIRIDAGDARSSHPKEIVYRPGVMPEDPDPDPWTFRDTTWRFSQGGMHFLNLDVWEEVNHEMAMNGNEKPFRECVREHRILL